MDKRPPVYVFKIQTPKRSASLRLEGPFFVLGRGEPYRIFHDDPTLSREHLAIVHTDDGYLVKDLGSRNGVILNGKRLERYGEAPFSVGDTVVAGSTRVQLVLQREQEVADEEVTVEPDGTSTAIPAIPASEEDEDFVGEVTGVLDRPEQPPNEDLERTMALEDEDHDGDPAATHLAEEEEDDLEPLPEDDELTFPEEEPPGVDALVADVEAASGSASGSEVELDAFAEDLGVSPGELDSALDSRETAEAADEAVEDLRGRPTQIDRELASQDDPEVLE